MKKVVNKKGGQPKKWRR